jgi:hypothetical protein
MGVRDNAGLRPDYNRFLHLSSPVLLCCVLEQAWFQMRDGLFLLKTPYFCASSVNICVFLFLGFQNRTAVPIRPNQPTPSLTIRNIILIWRICS